MALMIDTSKVGQGMLPLSFFQAAVAAGVTDACIKSGGADDGLYKDGAHDQSVAFARQVGLHIHHYFFNGPAATPAQCADAFYQYANPQPGDRMWWDIEPETGMAAWTAAQIAAADAQLSGEGRSLPGDYLNESEVLSGQWNTRSGDSLWEAAYITGTPSAGAFGAYSWWQYTDQMSIAGVTVDASRPGTGPTTNEIGDEDMPLNADTDYPAFLEMLQRAIHYDLRPNGGNTPGQGASAGATIWEYLASINTQVKSDAVSLTSDQVASIAASLKAALPATLTEAEVQEAVTTALANVKITVAAS